MYKGKLTNQKVLLAINTLQIHHFVNKLLVVMAHYESLIIGASLRALEAPNLQTFVGFSTVSISGLKP